MSVLFTNVEHVLATAASDVVKVAKFVEMKVVPVLKSVDAEASTVEAVTALVSPQAANIERLGFALLGLVIEAMDKADQAALANGLNVTLDKQLLEDVKAVAGALKSAVPLLAK